MSSSKPLRYMASGQHRVRTEHPQVTAAELQSAELQYAGGAARLPEALLEEEHLV